MLKINENSQEILFSITSPDDLTADVLKELSQTKKNLRFEWPRQDFDLQRFNEIHGEVFIQIGMEAAKISSVGSVDILPISTFHDQKSQALILETYETDYKIKWSGKIPEPILELFKTALSSITNQRTSRFVVIDGHLRGAIVVANFKTYRSELKDHIAWIWIDGSQPKAIRRRIGESLLNQAAIMAPEAVMAGVYSRNLKSFEFLRKAGFKSICATFLQP